MFKRVFFLVVLIILMFGIYLFGFKGSKKQNSVNNDIKSYIENDIGIKNYILSYTPTERIENDGYTDYIWHVKYQDIEFDVINNYYYSMESKTHRLDSDYEQKVMDYYAEHYISDKITYKKDYVYNKNMLICEVANEQKEIDESNLKECYNNIVEFIRKIDFEQYPMKNISVEITNKAGHVKWLLIYQDNHIKTFEEFKNSN